MPPLTSLQQFCVRTFHPGSFKPFTPEVLALDGKKIGTLPFRFRVRDLVARFCGHLGLTSAKRHLKLLSHTQDAPELQLPYWTGLGERLRGKISQLEQMQQNGQGGIVKVARKLLVLRQQAQYVEKKSISLRIRQLERDVSFAEAQLEQAQVADKTLAALGLLHGDRLSAQGSYLSELAGCGPSDVFGVTPETLSVDVDPLKAKIQQEEQAVQQIRQITAHNQQVFNPLRTSEAQAALVKAREMLAEHGQRYQQVVASLSRSAPDASHLAELESRAQYLRASIERIDRAIGLQQQQEDQWHAGVEKEADAALTSVTVSSRAVNQRVESVLAFRDKGARTLLQTHGNVLKLKQERAIQQGRLDRLQARMKTPD
jgi:hypothetical protein